MTLIASLVLVFASSVDSSEGLRRAVTQVQRETNGKILSARTVTVGRDQLYRIKVLTDEGRVQTRTIRPVARNPDSNSKQQGEVAPPKSPDSAGTPERPEQSDSKE